jgi:MinD-like ATPase involved in chromosome partitioning or flagellar assembly
MTQIVSLYSYRGGTGRSTTAANVARLLAGDGARVAVVDTALHQPALHSLFGIDRLPEWTTFTDYLLGRCPLWNVVREVPLQPSGPLGTGGRLYALPACNLPYKIETIKNRGYDIGMLGEAFTLLSEELELDYLILDTSAGLSNETLAALAGSHTVVSLARSDRVDLNTARLNAELLQRLSTGRMMLVLSGTEGASPAGLDAEFEKAYGLPVTAILPAIAEVSEVSGQTLFVETFPEHVLTARYREIADALAAAA